MPTTLTQRAGGLRGRLAVHIIRTLIVPVVLLTFARPGSAQEPAAVGGRVVDAATQTPLAAVSVTLRTGGAAARQVLTNADGRYVIPGVPAGSYVVSFAMPGYAPLTRTDVILSPGRAMQVDAALQVAAIELASIVVNTGYFERPVAEPASLVGLNAEEVRRAPGSAGDVSRVLFSLPSTAQVADNANDLYVRGGSPMENAFFIDGVQVPNINHFPEAGSTGGPIGMVNVEFIDDVKFSAGGFSAEYGDRLSSVVDIKFRDGARERLETRVEASMAGFGGSIEGPLGGKGSWFLAGRKSFLDLIVNAIGTGVAPGYGDIHAKASYEPTARDKVSVLGLFGASKIGYDEADSRDVGDPTWGDYSGHQRTVGLTWRHVWRRSGYSMTVVSGSVDHGQENWIRTATGAPFYNSDNVEGALRLRNVNHWRLSPRSSLEFGADAEMARSHYDYTVGEYRDRLGVLIPGESLNREYDDTRAGAFASHVWTPVPRLDITVGARADHYTGSGDTYLSPRFSTSFELSGRTRLNAAAGVYRQRLPSFLLSQDTSFDALPALRAVHYVVGVDHLLAPSTKLTVEIYDKEYDNFPVEMEDPALFVVDDGGATGHFRNYRTLVPDGRARTTGVEALLQKKLATDFYGLASASYFRSRYRAEDGVWRNRAYDNRFLFNVVGGYKPSHTWELSARWAMAGGVPYTPFDLAASADLDSGVIDATNINGARYPAYHTLNLRLDRRFVYRGSALTVNLSLWNVYNRQNVAMYYWNEVDNKLGTIYQWSFFPVAGMEWKF